MNAHPPHEPHRSSAEAKQAGIPTWNAPLRPLFFFSPLPHSAPARSAAPLRQLVHTCLLSAARAGPQVQRCNGAPELPGWRVCGRAGNEFVTAAAPVLLSALLLYQATCQSWLQASLPFGIPHLSSRWPVAHCPPPHARPGTALFRTTPSRAAGRRQKADKKIKTGHRASARQPA